METSGLVDRAKVREYSSPNCVRGDGILAAGQTKIALMAFLLVPEDLENAVSTTCDEISDDKCHGSTPYGINKDRYVIQSIVHACQLLESFRYPEENLRLQDMVSRTGLSKGIVFRVLYTLEKQGLLQRVSAKLWRSTVRPLRRKSWRIGYAAQGADYGFAQAVTESVSRACEAEGITLLVVDNRYSSRMALKNADKLIREQVDLAMEFQTDEQVAPIISSKYLAANIPLIAIEIPHPGASYYGANNYEAGLMGGHYLGKCAKQYWKGEVDQVILMELPRAGNLPRSRLTGTLAAVREVLRSNNFPVSYLNGDGQFEQSLEVVRKHLRKTNAKHVLISGINDASVLGALQAFEEAGRLENCIVVGQNASPEARAEIRHNRNTRLIGSVAYFPERYGQELVSVALDILGKKPIPPAVFVKHRMIDASNIDHFYPNDSLESAIQLARVATGSPR